MVTRVPSETHGNPEQNGQTVADSEPVWWTFAPWRIQRDPGRGDTKILARGGGIDQYKRGTVTGREDSDEQMALIHSMESGTLVVDVDDESFDGTALGEYLADYPPFCTRGADHGLPNRHYLIDMRGVAASGRWVRQGPIRGGDVKSSGFTPVPGSVHPSGERYEPFLDMQGQLSVVECTEELYALLVEARARAPHAAGHGGGGVGSDGQEPQLFSLTGRLVARGVPKEEAWRTWLETARSFPPKKPEWPWSTADRPVFERHWAFCVGQEGGVFEVPATWLAPAASGCEAEPAAAEPEPAVNWKVPDALGSPQEPMKGARALEERLYTGARALLIRRFWRGSFLAHTGAAWREVPDADVSAELYRIAEHACYRQAGDGDGAPKVKSWAPTTPKINNLRNALAAVLNTSDLVETGTWLDGRVGAPRLVACSNVLVDPMTGGCEPHTAAYFNGYALDFAYDKDAECPCWLGFLESVWPGDAESRTLLQQWFGYVLSGRTDLQKLMYLKGLPRSGKGTIARILTALLGAANVVGPTFDSFGGGFGLELLVNAQLAVVGDARFTGDPRVMQTAISKILSITGEDKLNVDRKYKTTWTGTLPTRLMLLSNEMPWFRDSSSAIVDRMLLLIFKESFRGREDHTLELRLRAELAGIFNWALAGYRELVIADGRFTRPAASRAVLDEFRESVSPIEAWLAQECSQEHESVRESVPCLRGNWERFCAENGHKPGTPTAFLGMVQTVWPKVARTDNKVTDGNGNRVRAWRGIRYRGPREE